MPEQDVICIVCPLGCRGKVIRSETGDVTFEGYGCKEGKKYAKSEATEPVRILTATILTESKIRPLLPVRTDKAIPKKKLKECMTVLAQVKARLPVRVGQVIIPDILGTGADVISTGEIVT